MPERRQRLQGLGVVLASQTSVPAQQHREVRNQQQQCECKTDFDERHGEYAFAVWKWPHLAIKAIGEQGTASHKNGRRVTIMGCQVCAGAVMQCSFGAAPSTLVVLPTNRVLTGTPAATIMDFAPIVNVPPFGMCSSPSNPAVIAATAAAMGVLTPMPCMPVPSGPWMAGAPTVLIGNLPALNDSSKLMCAWTGVINISVAGQATVMVP
ncbi:conserved hypothetical protein [Ricinus communis]|uniref:DUF4280 domain-containing protein n=1 Tax=Ricinus communis TaxID=3988 RepID=B9TBA8_RICCO|nr:conserved hypothetical protein [Ricinus communis]